MLTLEHTLFIGLLCGMIFGYAIGTLMWFERSAQ